MSCEQQKQRASPLLRMAAETDIPGPPYSGPPVKPILDSVTYPSDMKRLDMRELKQVRSNSSLMNES